MHKEARLPLGNPPEPMGGAALMALQLLVFPHGPPDQNPVQDPEGRVQRRFVVLPIILHPSAHNRIEHAREVVASFVATQVQPPTPNCLPHRGGRSGTDGGGEVDKVLPPAVLRPSWTKCIAQKVKA